MSDKINSIRRSHHPYSGEIEANIDKINRVINIIIILLDALGFIIAIAASTGLSELATHYKDNTVDVPINFFGYGIELESNTIFASPTAVFFFIIIVFAFICIGLWCVKKIAITALETKKNMLDSTYHTEKLSELFLENYNNLSE